MPSMKNMTCIEDLRQAARRRVPRAFFDYAEAGSYSRRRCAPTAPTWSGSSCASGCSSTSRSATRRRRSSARKCRCRSRSRPIGMGGLQHGNGEILACRAAQAAGIPYTLSTLSICSIEDVAGAVDKPFWFQLYVMKDRGFVRSLIERAAAAKCSALVLTVDLQVLGQRHADIKNGLSVPPSLKIRNLINMATKPRWVYSVLTGKRWTFGNLAGHVKGMEGVKSLAEWIAHHSIRR